MKKIIILLFAILLITGCSSNKELNEFTTNSFYDAATKYDLEVTSNVENYLDIEKYADAHIAKKDNKINIELVKYTSEENAEEIVKSHIRSFNMLKSTGASEINETGKNYHKYVLVSNNYYMVSIRINESVLFCKTKIDNKETVENVLKELDLL